MVKGQLPREGKKERFLWKLVVSPFKVLVILLISLGGRGLAQTAGKDACVLGKKPRSLSAHSSLGRLTSLMEGREQARRLTSVGGFPKGNFAHRNRQ